MANKDLSKSDPVGDIEAQMNRDFNTVIRKAYNSLSTKTHSPVYTGFFASSWKVDTKAIVAKDEVKNFKPWSNIKLAADPGGDKWKPAGFRPPNPKIQKRHEINKQYNIKRPVYIGNTVKYAAYALEGGKIQNFIQGRLAKIIKDTMTQKKGKLFLASRQTQGLSPKGTGGVGYSEVNFKEY
tara:strand:- start:444 stop:989 length:546 start_codon:yes stop_codon:yes gene_type:complete